MFCPFIVSTLTEGKRHFSGVPWLNEKTQRHHFDHIARGFTHICNRAVICLLRVFSLKFGPIIHASPMLPLLPFSPLLLPPSSSSLFSLAVSCALLCGQCGENAWSTPRRAAGRFWVRDMWPRAQICDSLGRPRHGRHSRAWEKRRRERPKEWGLTAETGAATSCPVGAVLTSTLVFLFVVFFSFCHNL